MSGKIQYQQNNTSNNHNNSTAISNSGGCCGGSNCGENKQIVSCNINAYDNITNGTNNGIVSNLNNVNSNQINHFNGNSITDISSSNNNNSSCNNNNSSSNNNNNNNCNTVNNNNSSNNNTTANNTSKNRICRNFVRGLCRRKHCKYPHVLSPDQVVFCHDFQNSNCPRMNCKFLHYTLQEEEYYRKYGEFPQDYMINDNGPPLGPQNPSQALQNGYKDYMNYGSCRYHDCYMPPVDSLSRDLIKESPMWGDHHPGYRIDDRLISSYRNDDFKSVKRSARSSCDSGGQFKRYREETDRCIDIMAMIRRFEEEQVMLRRRVEANEIKIAELRATNEYLVAQSAQLRLNNQVVQQQHQQQQQPQQVQVQQQTQQCSNVVNPVTVTQTTTQPQQVIGSAVSIAPVQVQATPIVSIATPQTQIITNGGGTPLAIAAANTSQGQQLAALQQNITSLSNTSQSIPPAAQQILGTSQITLTPAIAQGASMGLTINTSQALAMSNATQPNISYPVMTHSILPHCNN